ncbi:hypothetical protein OSTOST_19512 [Ostertagia ostertagi]
MLVRTVVIQYPPVSGDSVPQRSMEMFQRYSETVVNVKECSVPPHPNERYYSKMLAHISSWDFSSQWMLKTN